MMFRNPTVFDRDFCRDIGISCEDLPAVASSPEPVRNTCKLQWPWLRKNADKRQSELEAALEQYSYGEEQSPVGEVVCRAHEATGTRTEAVLSAADRILGESAPFWAMTAICGWTIAIVLAAKMGGLW